MSDTATAMEELKKLLRTKRGKALTYNIGATITKMLEERKHTVLPQERQAVDEVVSRLNRIIGVHKVVEPIDTIVITFLKAVLFVPVLFDVVRQLELPPDKAAWCFAVCTLLLCVLYMLALHKMPDTFDIESPTLRFLLVFLRRASSVALTIIILVIGSKVTAVLSKRDLPLGKIIKVVGEVLGSKIARPWLVASAVKILLPLFVEVVTYKMFSRIVKEVLGNEE